MSLHDYSYIVGLGFECATTWQIMRATALQGMQGHRSSGPFDWFQIDPDHVVEILANDFAEFFDPTTVRVDGDLHQHTWKVANTHGVASWHHLPFRPPEAAPGPWSWFQFGMWLGERLAYWSTATKDPAANILFVRAEDPLKPDDDDALHRLATALSKTVAGKFRLAAVSYDRSASRDAAKRPQLNDPRISRFVVDRSWPAELAIEDIDWNRDYGQGVAWRGSTASWDKVWSAV